MQHPRTGSEGNYRASITRFRQQTQQRWILKSSESVQTEQLRKRVVFLGDLGFLPKKLHCRGISAFPYCHDASQVELDYLGLKVNLSLFGLKFKSSYSESKSKPNVETRGFGLKIEIDEFGRRLR
ncbi:hypothetical protein V8G54_029927 [Vigna mungo]|uniref:Uncharacterized protein n=1 Tax=Vigna mungo TaxID=3915 RepID=A0AAQ3MVE1_VIGMU